MLDCDRRFICHALLFDLDGVLVDSTRCIEDSWRLWAARHGLDPATVLAAAHGRRASETVRLVASHLDADAEAAALIGHEVQATTGVLEARGAAALVSCLPRDRWAVVTSGVRAVAEHRLRRVGLSIPNVMICADDVRRGKPDPEGFLAAAARLATVPDDCIVVEDAPIGLQAAHAAGMRALAIAGTYPAPDLHPALAVVQTLEQVMARWREGPGHLEIGCAPVDVRDG